VRLRAAPGANNGHLRPGDEEQFIALPVKAYHAAGGDLLVHEALAGSIQVLSRELLEILLQADHFDTIKGHIQTLLRAGWQDDGSGYLYSVFRELNARGLMCSKATFLRNLMDSEALSAVPPPISFIAWTTRDRPEELAQSISSFADNNRRFGRKPQYLILDDSRSDIAGDRIRNAFARFAEDGISLLYAGLREKQQFCQELVRMGAAEGLPEEVARFALFGEDVGIRTLGANRNALLLSTRGELTLTVDDDSLCRLTIPHDFELALALDSRSDPTEIHSYASRAELIEAIRTSEADLLAAHETILGRSIAGCKAALGAETPVRLEHLASESVGLLLNNPSTVRVTMCGLWGDSGMGSPRYVFELQGKSRELLMRSEEAYSLATSSREMLRCAPQYTLSDGALFMATNAGIDNRRRLPPFFPVGRNSDGIFAITLRACAREALIGHLPWAVLHAPRESRSYGPGALLEPSPRLAEVMTMILGGINPPPWARSFEERLQTLGKYLLDLGSQRLNDFEEQLKMLWLAAASQYISRLEYLLDFYSGKPVFWARDVLAFIEALKDFAMNRAPGVPRDLAEGRSPEQARESVRSLVRKYGELLIWWPVLDRAAGQLCTAGLGLARPFQLGR